MPDKYGLAVPGDTVYKPVTDHPNFAGCEVHRGDGYYSPKREVAQHWVDVWNECAPNPEWTWYVKAFTLLPPRGEPEPVNDAQMTLW